MPRKHKHKHDGKNSPSTQADWGYDDNDGPCSWPKSFPAGRGERQSPVDINISATYVQYDGNLGPIVVNYDRCNPQSIFNSGHGFQVRIDDSSPAILTGGPLGNSQYQLAQFHGHWGQSNREHGSEHTINGHSFPSELHFVHYNKAYGTLAEAVQHPDGLAVIGVFLKVGEQRHPELQNLIEDLQKIDYDNHDVPLDIRINPQHFLPQDLGRYFTYYGSLTTPPLTECVVWIVMADPLQVSYDQLAPFREMHSAHEGHNIGHNYRPVQPINNRIIRASFASYYTCGFTKTGTWD